VRVRVVANGLLLGLMLLAIVGVEAFDRSESAVEASVRRYAVGVSTSDLDAALAEIAPSQRPTWEDWVSQQLGNVYYVRGIAVRARSLLGRPVEVTAVLDVNRDDPEDFYQPTATVPVLFEDGRWYLAQPLLSAP
jgi:hypothetical protein